MKSFPYKEWLFDLGNTPGSEKIQINKKNKVKNAIIDSYIYKNIWKFNFWKLIINLLLQWKLHILDKFFDYFYLVYENKDI